MKIPKERVAWLGAQALQRIIKAPLPDQKRFLLSECVQAYLPLDEEQQQEYQRLVAGESYGEVRAMNVTWYEKGVEKGRREMLRELLEDCFGPLPAPALERLQQASPERLAELRKKLRQAQSLRDLGLAD